MFQRWINISEKNHLILGPRRAGKTTLLKRRFPQHAYYTLDDFDYLRFAQNDPKGFVQSMPDKAIIDEIQRVPKLTIALKERLDRSSFQLLLTGSSSIGLLDSAADSLAGRIYIKHLPTACFGEREGAPTKQLFLEKHNPLELAEAQRQLTEFIKYGGFPEVLEANQVTQKHELLKMYRDSYFTRDLAQLSNIENIEGLLAILMHAQKSLGAHLEVSNFARESGLSHPSAKKYLNVITQSDLAFKLYGYQYGPAKRYLKAAKLYFADTGIIHALGPQISEGQLIENFVIAEIEKRRKLGFIRADQLFYYKSAGGKEIDLLFEQDGTLFIIEIKSTRHPQKKDVSHLLAFCQEHKTQRVRPYLFCMCNEYQEIASVPVLPIASLWRAV